MSLKGTESRKGVRTGRKPPHARGLRWGGCHLTVVFPRPNPSAHSGVRWLGVLDVASPVPCDWQLPAGRRPLTWPPLPLPMSGSGALPLATVKLEGACARPASWSRLVTWKGAETAVQRRALRLPFPVPQLPPETKVSRRGNERGGACCQVLSSDWLSGNLRQPRGKDYLASRMRNR